MVIPYRASELTPAAWTIQEKGIETAPNMKQLAPDIYQRYHAALRAHLGDRRPSGMAAARGLGRELMAAGFDTLALARLHEQALLPLASSHDFARTRNGLNRRAGNFFAAVLSPMEKIHRATRESVLHMKQRAETLRHHTAALTSGKRQLRREVARRKAGEDAVNKGFKDYRRLFMQSQSLETQLRHLARQLLTALEDERRKISRDLHDVVVQTLVGINLQLAELSKSASPRVQTLKMKIARTQRLVEKSVREVHQFARALRPAVLDDLGLNPALRNYLRVVAARENLKINLSTFDGVEALDNEKRTVLFRVAQEALTNVGRHARASIVDVTVSAVSDAVRIEVHDNGRSFQVPKTLSARTNRRLGLVGMRERVEMVGGVLVIESAPGRGTTVRADVPYSNGGAK